MYDVARQQQIRSDEQKIFFECCLEFSLEFLLNLCYNKIAKVELGAMKYDNGYRSTNERRIL